MGLAMVRKNVEVYGGTLNLESSEGKGSIFRFTWPKQQQMRREDSDEHLPRRRTAGLNILLVEDDDGDAKALERAFRKSKIANPILRAVDGIEALEMLRGTQRQRRSPRLPICCSST